MRGKWTPAPWVIIPARPYDGDDPDLDGSFYTCAGIEGADGSPVCVFGDASGSATMFENEHDHRLIAAAPDLLAALTLAEDVLSRFPFSCEIWPDGTHPNTGITQIRAAIAKAEGRS